MRERLIKWLSNGWLIAVFAFLYLPIVTLVILSFNASPQVTVWGGGSTKWYVDLSKDTELISGFILSMKIALASATSSVLLGLVAGFALHRYKRFRGRTMFVGMVNSPLVMPEVIMGLSLLLMLVAIQQACGWPQRGFFTILLGHTLLGMAYATVVVQSRLQELDKSLDEAAQDLGCRPIQVFGLVTLPIILQSLGSAWLLTFSMSLDDVVTSAFLSGPGSTTMPLVIFSRARLGLSPSVNTVATLTVAVVVIATIIASIVMARNEKRRAAEMSAAYRMG